MFSQDDGRLFLRLGIMLAMHVTKTIKSRTQCKKRPAKHTSMRDSTLGYSLCRVYQMVKSISRIKKDDIKIRYQMILCCFDIGARAL